MHIPFHALPHSTRDTYRTWLPFTSNLLVNPSFVSQISCLLFFFLFKFLRIWQTKWQSTTWNTSTFEKLRIDRFPINQRDSKDCSIFPHGHSPFERSLRVNSVEITTMSHPRHSIDKVDRGRGGDRRGRYGGRRGSRSWKNLTRSGANGAVFLSVRLIN